MRRHLRRRELSRHGVAPALAIRIVLRVALCAAIVLGPSAVAHAEDGTTLRRTTPRAPMRVTAEQIAFGVPSGRAWGLESTLIPIRGSASVALDLGVSDASVREAFVRIAWYDRDEGRPRQMLVADAPYVLPGVERRVLLQLEPPEGAVAFRIRVLARVMPGAYSSREGAVAVARVRVDRPARLRPALTRLWAEPP